MSNLFTEESVLYRITPTEEENKYFIFPPKTVVATALNLFVEQDDGSWSKGNTLHASLMVARLLSELNGLKDYIGAPGGPPYDELVRENDRLAADLTLAQLDVARYRYLREIAYRPVVSGVPLIELHFMVEQSSNWPADQDAATDLDCAVDRARQG